MERLGSRIKERQGGKTDAKWKRWVKVTEKMCGSFDIRNRHTALKCLILQKAKWGEPRVFGIFPLTLTLHEPRHTYTHRADLLAHPYCPGVKKCSEMAQSGSFICLQQAHSALRWLLIVRMNKKHLCPLTAGQWIFLKPTATAAVPLANSIIGNDSSAYYDNCHEFCVTE